MTTLIASELIVSTLKANSKPWADGRGGLLISEITKLTGLPPSTFIVGMKDLFNNKRIFFLEVDRGTFNPPVVSPIKRVYLTKATK